MSNLKNFDLILNHTEIKNGLIYDSEYCSTSSVTACDFEDAIYKSFGLKNVVCEGVASGRNIIQVSENGNAWVAYSYNEDELMKVN